MASVLVKIMAGQQQIIPHMHIIPRYAGDSHEEMAQQNNWQYATKLQLPLRRLGLCCLLAQILVTGSMMKGSQLWWSSHPDNGITDSDSLDQRLISK